MLLAGDQYSDALADLSESSSYVCALNVKHGTCSVQSSTFIILQTEAQAIEDSRRTISQKTTALISQPGKLPAKLVLVRGGRK